MELIPSEELEALTLIANRLPASQSIQLLDLIASWKVCSRESPRLQYDEQIPFIVNGETHAGKVRNLSTSGLFLLGNWSMRVGEQVLLRFPLGEAPLLVELAGTIVRRDQNGIGVRFNYDRESDQSLIDDLLESCEQA